MAEVIDAFEAGELKPAYYLCGETYPRDRLLAALRRRVVGTQAVPGFNIDVFEGKGAQARAITAAANTMPMLGGKRLVEVRDAHLMDGEELNGLLDYLQRPNPHACVVFVAEKADLRLKFFTALKKVGVVERFEPLKERQAGAWLENEAKRQRIACEAGAAACIADAVGTDMAQLVMALERVALFAGPGQRVTRDHVEQVLVQTRQRSVFELTDAIGRGQRREAMLILRQMLQAREPPLRLVGMLARQVRQLWQARLLRQAGRAPKEIAEKIGAHPFFVNDIVAQAERLHPSRMHGMHQALLDTDRALKSSRLPDSAVMERLVLRLCPANEVRR